MTDTLHLWRFSQPQQIRNNNVESLTAKAETYAVSSPLALDKVKNPGRRGAEIEIAPVRGDVTNGKGQRVTKLPKGA